MKLTFLGTGTSFGVPQIGCSCRVCRSSDPRDKRTRVGALVDDTAAFFALQLQCPEAWQVNRRPNQQDIENASAHFARV